MSLLKRLPNKIIYRGKDKECVYRWYLFPENRLFNIYLHKTILNDDAPPHDHPWYNVSIILKGGYWENECNPTLLRNGKWALPMVKHWRGPGKVIFRRATYAHRIEVENTIAKVCWSLFIVGPVIRDWGFWGVRGWVTHKLILDIICADGVESSHCNFEKAKHWLYDNDFPSKTPQKNC